MPNVIETPEFIVTEQDDQVEIERSSQPSAKPFRSVLRRALGAITRRDEAQHGPSLETAIDRLARQEPYLYIRAICG